MTKADDCAFLSDEARWTAVESRDPAANGRFFVCVRTTGIYCRSVCPARPLRRNVQLVETAAAAARAGFRACKRCRPDAAPASAAIS